MANRQFTQFRYSLRKMPVKIDVEIPIGATGAVGTVSSPGVASVTRLAAGIYKVRFQDNYYDFFGMSAAVQAPVAGAAVALGSLTPGLVYQISSLGNSTAANWITAGVPQGITPAVGVVFLAAATSSGTGEADLLGASGVSSIEVIGNTQLQLNPIGVGLVGGYAVVKCMGPTFTGSALAGHTHNFTVIGGQAGATTNAIAAYAGPLIGKEAATDATFLGSASATNGGVVSASAGTPAGSVAFGAVDPADGSRLFLDFYLSNTSVTY